MEAAAFDADVVRAERVRELYGQPGVAGYAANAIVVMLIMEVVVIVWPVTRPEPVLAWAGIMLAVQAALCALVWAFHRRPQPSAGLRAWGRRRAALEAAHGLGWALSVLLVHTPGETISLLAIMVTVVGLTSGVAAGLAVHMPSLASFVACAMLPAAGFLLWVRAGAAEVYAAVMMTTTLALVLANAARMSLLYEESIRLRLNMGAQIDERRQLQEAAEQGRFLAEAAAAERVRFFGAASHDLRQPVHALGLYAALLRRDPPAAERRELITGIAACVDALERLFTSILGVAHAADARQKAAARPLAVQEVIAAVVAQFRPEAARRGLTLRAPSTSLWVQGDPAVLERILANLLANALRYTQKGGVLVGARRRGGSVDLVVADTGVGLSPADCQRIFDPFFQVGRPAGGRSEGFGLGLATVRQLSLTHGYQVGVQSTPDRGSLFRVTAQRAARTAEAPPPGGQEVVPSSLRVLLVEDDHLVADAVTRMLSAWGVDIRAVQTAPEALEVLASQPAGRWHAILDYRLAGPRNGLELAIEIRARHGAAVSLSLLTGEADPAIFEAARDAGVLVLQKPLKPIRLRALLAASGAEMPA
jgi:signal transduction histidine kinase